MIQCLKRVLSTRRKIWKASLSINALYAFKRAINIYVLCSWQSLLVLTGITRSGYRCRNVPKSYSFRNTWDQVGCEHHFSSAGIAWVSGGSGGKGERWKRKRESWRRETPDTDAFSEAFHPHTAWFDTIQSKSLPVNGLSASRVKKLA